MLQVLYPAGCQPVIRELEDQELEKRLKALADTVRYWATSDYETYKIYEPLAYHLADPHFLSHSNDNIQLLVASCLSDIFRVFTPKSPYSQSAETLVEVLLCLTKERKDFQDPSKPLYNVYLYTLANVIRIDLFALCSNVPTTKDTNKILQSLLTIIDENINKGTDEYLHRMFTEPIRKILKSSNDEMIEKLLAILFLNIPLEEAEAENAVSFLKTILTDFKEILWPLLEKNFIKILTNSGNEDLPSRIISITKAVSSSFPEIIHHILPQLKTFLNSPNHITRRKAVVILIELLSTKLRDPASAQYAWRRFLRAFMDQDERIRAVSIKAIPYFFDDESKRAEMLDRLKLLLHDRAPCVKIEIIWTIYSLPKEDVDTLIKDFNPFAGEDLGTRKHILKELATRTNEERKNTRTFDVTKSAMASIFNEILCQYYNKDEEDRSNVEKLVFSDILRFRDEVRARMKTLYFLFARTDDNGSRAFAALLVHRHTIRKCLSNLFESKQQLKHENSEPKIAELKELNKKQLKLISKFFGNPDEAEVNLQKFFEKIDENPALVEYMKIILKPKVSCEQSGEAINEILAEFPDPNDPYYNTVKVLLERSSTILIEEEAVVSLIKHIHDDEIIKFIGLKPSIVIEKGFKLLEILSFAFAPHFTNPRRFGYFVKILETRMGKGINIKVFNILRHIGKFKDLRRICSTSWKNLERTCKVFIIEASPEEAKAAIRLISSSSESEAGKIFGDILEKIKTEISDPSSENVRTSIASLGYISSFFGGMEREIYELINTVYQKILIPDPGDSGDNVDSDDWCDKELLPPGTKYRLEAMKCIMRWLISRKPPEKWIAEILRVLTAFISRNGDVNRRGNLTSNEKSWLKLQAGSCLLKLCRFERIGNELKPEQFYELSKLMLDDVYEVRKIFHEKLKRGLTSRCPRECLPIDFMGFYALGGLEENDELRDSLKRGMLLHIAKRKQNSRKWMGLKELQAREEKVLRNITPQCGVIYAVIILAHWKGFSASDEEEELRGFKRGLEFVMEHWFTRDDGRREERIFFEQLMKRLRACKDANNPEDEGINARIRTICDVATWFLKNDVKRSRWELQEDDGEVFKPEIPKRYLQFDEELPEETEDALRRREILEEILKGLEKNERRTKKRKTGKSRVQESPSKRRRGHI